MFTGIVETLGTVCAVEPDGPGRRLVIERARGDVGCAIGDSIAVNGVCLTVVRWDETTLVFEVGPETLARTNLGALAPGDRVNIERALLPTTRLGGHFVEGHVDGVAQIAERRREGDWEWVEFAAATELTAQMVVKGPVALDGVSLTLVAVSPGRFRVMLIPHTLRNTTLGSKGVGASVNVETDILGKYVFEALRAREATP